MKTSVLVIGIGLMFAVPFSIIAADGRVVVDFSQPIGPVTQRACGFLHGVGAYSPEDSLLEPLKIRYIRGAPHGGISRLLDEGVLKRLNRPSLQLAVGVYYYDKKKMPGHEEYYPGDDGDWAAWDKIVENVVKEARDKEANCYWVIWNEPDYKKFWPRDVHRFHEAWNHAWHKIKSMDRNAVITGPTITHYSFEYLKEFLSYCQKNSCVPEMVTWHELSRTENQIEAHVEEIRHWCKKHHVDIQGVVIDEYGSTDGQYLPGPLVGFLSAFEKAKVAYASRALWTRPGTLNGAVTRDGKKPTGLWWVYKSYSDMSGKLYSADETKNIRVVASGDEKASSSILLIGNQSARKRNSTLVLRHCAKIFGHVSELQITRRLIPNSGGAHLESPKTLPAVVTKLVDDELTVEAGSLPGDAAMEIQITPLGAKP